MDIWRAGKNRTGFWIVVHQMHPCGHYKKLFIRYCMLARKSVIFADQTDSHLLNVGLWFLGRVVRHSSAKAATAVRIRQKPRKRNSPSTGAPALFLIHFNKAPFS